MVCFWQIRIGWLAARGRSKSSIDKVGTDTMIPRASCLSSRLKRLDDELPIVPEIWSYQKCCVYYRKQDREQPEDGVERTHGQHTKFPMQWFA